MNAKELIDGALKTEQPYRVRLPLFISDEGVGLGNVIKRVTSTFRIKPGGGCEGRAATLNHWVVFTGARARSPKSIGRL